MPVYALHVANLDDVRRIASGLPGARESDGKQFAMEVEVKGKMKGFAWSWMERVDPKKARVVNEHVLAVSVPNLTTKDLLIDSDPSKFFTEPHYKGYPAILVRLDQIEPRELEGLLVEAWRVHAPKALLERFEQT